MVILESTEKGNFQLSGTDVKIVQSISEQLNFNIVYKLSQNGKWGNIYPNGSTTGAIKVLLEGKADMIMGFYLMKQSRMGLMANSVPYDNSPLFFVAPPGRRLSSFRKLFKTFDRFVWFSLAFVLLFLFFIIFVINCQPAEIRIMILGRNVQLQYLNILSTVFGIADSVVMERNVARLFWTLFTLECLIIR